PGAAFFDTHCHLYYDDFDADRAEMFARAKAVGVNTFLNVGVNLAISKVCLEYAEKYPNVYASAGVHPTEAHKAAEEDFAEIEALLKHPRVVALGEVGLDFYHQDSPRDIQEKVFIRFLEMQQRVKKPLIIHSRDCFDRLLEMLRDFGKAPYAGVFHCFTGDRAVMKQCLDLGFHISFSGILTYKKNDELRAACAECPQDRVLIETDCPYLPPQSMRGKRNEPALMLETAQMAAQVRGVSVEELARLTTRNGFKLFGIKV
ncbi:MAG TPA: TatD family hydrolase, partial [Candidatus Omnitrophota bacterium]|nr:TatD family hydrolase [Candidatus Omnitrophota bacterium]